MVPGANFNCGDWSGLTPISVLQDSASEATPDRAFFQSVAEPLNRLLRYRATEGEEAEVFQWQQQSTETPNDSQVGLACWCTYILLPSHCMPVQCPNTCPQCSDMCELYVVPQEPQVEQAQAAEVAQRVVDRGMKDAALKGSSSTRRTVMVYEMKRL